MAKCGIERIDKLFEAEAGSDPIREDDSDSPSVGLIQDLLLGHGYKVPGLRSTLRGKVTPGTRNGIKDFRAKHSITIGPGLLLDHRTLVALVKEPASEPLASVGYLTLKLDMPLTGAAFVLPLIAAFEGRGQFTALNPNTDRQGLSFGLIQWAQSRGRLSEIVQAFRTRSVILFDSTFGGVTAAAGMVEHVKLGAAGLCSKGDVAGGGFCKDKKVGTSKNPAFELTDATWQSRFAAAGLNTVFQKVQVAEALKDIKKNAGIVKGYADAVIKSVRGYGFMLDLSNQHGPFVGKFKTGAKAIFQKSFAPGLSEQQVLEKMRDESVRILKKQYGDNSAEARSTADRRSYFSDPKNLPDTPFQE
jgi:peptidoglycan hydrolase-like protein with peptidoglycan-binding domain